jgi:hypothetical protein
MTAHELAHGLELLLHMVREVGVLGTLAIIAGFFIVVLVFGAWTSLAEWMLRSERSLPIAYFGGAVAALEAVVLISLLVAFFDAKDTLKGWLVFVSFFYGFAVGGTRERHALGVVLFGLVSTWGFGLTLMRHELHSFNIPYFFAGFTVAGALLGLVLSKR